MKGAGELNERITIQRATVSTNDFNEAIETWSTLATVWANRRDASGSERYRAMEVNAEISVRFTVRIFSTISDVNANDRISYDGDIYNITAVREVDRNRMLEIDAVVRRDIEHAESSP